ncbi:hypothetical protein GGF32_001421 [Allomyces javanicus]|nr:hypothetical protein GGF32_001421 [Allomyces javanicus]
MDMGLSHRRRRLRPRARPPRRLQLADLPLDVFRAIITHLLANDRTSAGCLSVDASIVPTILALRRTCKTWQRAVDDKLFWHVNVEILVKPDDDDLEGNDSSTGPDTDIGDQAGDDGPGNDTEVEEEEEDDDESDISMSSSGEVDLDDNGASRPPLSTFGVVRHDGWIWAAVREERSETRQAGHGSSRKSFAFDDFDWESDSDASEDDEDEEIDEAAKEEKKSSPHVVPDIAWPRNLPHATRIRSLGISLPAIVNELDEFDWPYGGLGALLVHLVGQFPHLSALAVASKPLPGRVIAPVLASHVGTLEHIWISVLAGWNDIVAQYLRQLHHRVIRNAHGGGPQPVLALPQPSRMIVRVRETIGAADLALLAGSLSELRIRSCADPTMVSSTTLVHTFWPVLQSIDVPAAAFKHLFHRDPTGMNHGLVLPKVRTLLLHGHDDPDRCVWHNAVRPGSLAPAPALPPMPQLTRAQFTDIALTDGLLVRLATTSPLLAALKMAHCTLTRLGTNLTATFPSLARLEVTRSTTAWGYLVETATAPRLAELMLHDGEVKTLAVPWTTVTTLDLMLEQSDFPFGGKRLDATVLNRLTGLKNLLLFQHVSWSHGVFPPLAALTHLKAEQGNVSELVAHGAFAHLTHVDLLNDTRGIMVETLPMTVRSVKASIMHPRLIECLSRIPDLEFVHAQYVGASCPWALVHTTPRPAPLDVLHLEYHEDSALWPGLLDMGWFRNRPAKSLRIDVVSVGANVNRTSYLLFSTVCWVRGHDVNIALVEGDEDGMEDEGHQPFRVDITFMPGVDDSARPMLTVALAEFTMLVDETLYGNVRSAGAAADQGDDIAVDVDELVLESDDEDEDSDADKDMQDEEGKEE